MGYKSREHDFFDEKFNKFESIANKFPINPIRINRLLRIHNTTEITEGSKIFYLSWLD